MKKLTHSQFFAKLATHQGATPIGLDTLTDAKARKTDNPYGKILKSSRAVGFVGAKYENSVNRELAREGKESEFAAGKLPWGRWVIPGKVIEHKGEFYLRTQSSPGQRKFRKVRTFYRTEDGKFLKREQAEPFLPKKKESAAQAEVGLEDKNQIKVNNFAFSSIKKVRFGGESFVLVPDKEMV